MEWLLPVLGGLFTSLVNTGGFANTGGKQPEPKQERTPLQPMGSKASGMTRQRRNPYADAVAGGMGGGMSGDPGMIRLEAARSLRQGA